MNAQSTKKVLVDRLIKVGYAKPTERKALMQYDVETLQSVLDRYTEKKQPRHRPQAEYAHPFSCEGLGQWD